jgi:hypothetical protein
LLAGSGEYGDECPGSDAMKLVSCIAGCRNGYRRYHIKVNRKKQNLKSKSKTTN